MRIRTDGDKAYRKDAIENAAKVWDCNKTEAVVRSCDLVGRVLPAIEDALAEADIPPSEAQAICEKISTRHVALNYEHATVEFHVE